MKRLVYYSLMLFWVYVFLVGNSLVAIVLGYYTRQFFNMPSDQAPAAPALTLMKTDSCNCLTHRLVGRIKMAA